MGGERSATHLSHVQQVDLQEEAESAACDLVGRAAHGVAQLVAHGQAVSPFRLEKRERVKEEHSIKDRTHITGMTKQQIQCQGYSIAVTVSALSARGGPFKSAGVLRAETETGRVTRRFGRGVPQTWLTRPPWRELNNFIGKKLSNSHLFDLLSLCKACMFE